MKLKEIIGLIDGEFNMYIRGIKLINNRIEKIPRDLMNCDIEKIDFSDYIDLYLKEN